MMNFGLIMGPSARCASREQSRVRFADQVVRAAANGHRALERLFDQPIIAVATVGDRILPCGQAGAGRLREDKRWEYGVPPKQESVIGGPEHSTLANDAFPSREFDFMLSNPRYRKSWKSAPERMGGRGVDGDVKARDFGGEGGGTRYSELNTQRA